MMALVRYSRILLTGRRRQQLCSDVADASGQRDHHSGIHMPFGNACALEITIDDLKLTMNRTVQPQGRQ